MLEPPEIQWSVRDVIRKIPGSLDKITFKALETYWGILFQYNSTCICAHTKLHSDESECHDFDATKR